MEADMTQDEATLALLEAGGVEAERTEATRQARYAAEDADRRAARAEEDRLRDEGAKHREAVKASLVAAIAARENTPEKQAQVQMADLAAKVAALEAASVAPAPAA
jgi:hypothetical protein